VNIDQDVGLHENYLGGSAVSPSAAELATPFDVFFVKLNQGPLCYAFMSFCMKELALK
jgi:hypothetical protein